MKKNHTIQLPQAESKEMVKLKLYNFEKKLKPQVTATKRLRDSILSNRSLSLDPTERNHHILRPKIPSKRLFQQPQFLLSIQRKKTKVIQKLSDSDIITMEGADQSGKLKNLKYCKTLPLKQRKISDLTHEKYTHNDIGNFESLKKKPLINYNLQYLIRQKKKERESKKIEIMSESLQKHQTFLSAGKLDSAFDSSTLEAPKQVRSFSRGQRENGVDKTREASRQVRTRAQSRQQYQQIGIL